MDFDHFGVIFRSKSSLTGHIDNHSQPIFPQQVKVKLFTPYIVDLEIEEARRDLFVQSFSSRFENQLLK